MTIYERLTGRQEFCEERCREASDSYMKEFWAKTADQFQKMAMRLTTKEAAAPYCPPRGGGGE